MLDKAIAIPVGLVPAVTTAITVIPTVGLTRERLVGREVEILEMGAGRMEAAATAAPRTAEAQPMDPRTVLAQIVEAP